MPASDQGVSASRDRYHLVPRVLCFVTHADEVLLLKGAPDKKIWAGKYNGLGGHVERGESVLAAARREIREEAGLDVEDLQLRGVITVDTGEPLGIGLYVFTAHSPTRTVQPSSEGELEWVPARSVSGLNVVDDLPLILPHVLSMSPGSPVFAAQYTYDTNGRLRIAFNR